jgi:hypothetical protein
MSLLAEDFQDRLPRSGKLARAPAQASGEGRKRWTGGRMDWVGCRHRLMTNDECLMTKEIRISKSELEHKLEPGAAAARTCIIGLMI